LIFRRRYGGRVSELSPEETIRRTLSLLKEYAWREHLLKGRASEPPRLRTILGAIGEQVGAPPVRLKSLRDSLNPLSRFDFGLLAALSHASSGRQGAPPPMKLFEH
jgi:hypothetical protein